MNLFNVFKTRGKKQTFQYGNNSLSITELLKKPEIVNYLEKGKKLTYASQRDKLRKLLREKGDDLQGLVMEYNLENPPRQQEAREIPLYGAQVQRARRPSQPRRPLGSIIINGENLMARQTLERYPNLRNELQKNRVISEKSLRAKVITCLEKIRLPTICLD